VRTRPAVAIAAALAALAPAAATPTWAREQPMQVVVVKRAGVTAYEEVAEEFDERCRVRARVVSFGDEGLPAAPFDADELVVVTVGQEALDALKGTRAQLIPTLAFHAPVRLVGPPAAPHPELVLRALALARPQKIRVVGTVYGPRSEAIIKEAQKAAERLGLVLLAMRANDGPSAVRALHELSGKVHALWLPGDTDVLTPQLFQYALLLQLERGLPVAAATRQQVHSGALIAADFSPRAAGRIAADVANRYLDGLDVSTTTLDLYSGARLTVNATVAARLGADVPALLRMGARLE
jgi:hypothetical protein